MTLLAGSAEWQTRQNTSQNRISQRQVKSESEGKCDPAAVMMAKVTKKRWNSNGIHEFVFCTE
jgi:hypothetical protein